MLQDIVIDTNVFMHTADERQGAVCEAARELCQLLQNCQTNLCVDPGFHPDVARNRSRIAHEYYEHISFAHPVAFALISFLGRTGRIIQTSRDVDRAASKLIRQRVSDNTDRVFVMVTINSQSKTLVSHDFRHLPSKSRKGLLNKLRVNITDAEEASQML